MAPLRRTDMKSVLRLADCICFDVDSTAIIDEGIDELAAFLGVGKQVAELTRNAMRGNTTYQESLTQRLNIMKPSQQKVSKFIRENPPRLTDGVIEFVDLLQDRGVDVYLVSGGFKCLINPVAEALSIPPENVYANRLKFFFDGQYAGFDEKQPTCQSGGKPKVIQSLKDKHGYRCVLHIGDGSTDLEAYPPADGFIGFGGNQVREKVKMEAPMFVNSFQELVSILQSTKTPKLNSFSES